jgi:hypothetical protein
MAPIFCPYCGGTFVRPSGLTTHLRSKHQDQHGLPVRQPNSRLNVHIDASDQPSFEEPIIGPMSLTYQHAGTPINGVIETPLYEREGWDPFFPFKTLEQWQLAHTMVEANMSKSLVDRLLCRNLVNPSAQVATVDQLCKILQQMPERDSMPVKW